MSFETTEKPITEPNYFEGNQWELPTDIGLVDKAEERFKLRLLEIGWEEDADWLATSFGEALINAIVHGNLGVKEKPEAESWRQTALRVQQEKPSAKKVFVSFSITPERISVTIRDEGDGFVVNEIIDPTKPEVILKPSGRGFPFMRTFFDSVVHNEKGNEVTMEKTKH